MQFERPYSAASERNREPILTVLRAHFADRRQVLEIGSGSGQHAVHFAAALPALRWQCSDRAEMLPGMRLWLDEAALANTPAPLVLDVGQAEWPAGPYDALYSANTLHIMSWEQVQTLFARLPALTTPDAKLAVYGPFNYGGTYTAPSNAEFDAWLKARDPRSGIRDFEAVDALAREAGLALLADVAMPANNRCLIWQRALP
ncbi:DUF938 domain-containing protein [Stagnimonas aquatica]|uniref:DUF938 domain-containing protein n=1 Tax=Stagnimonas aquatica TaxID=2689987 RepID=A0A3N0UZM7_9GAMM|nr:DUF938 domain-containing protein [Stagnimonas aquatica]ROH86006.1 DUF938 domain-containing protein [Stagnimonas aquatica]